MDKSLVIDKFSNNSDHRLLLSHIYDLMIRCSDRNIITVSNFISEAEISIVKPFLSSLSCTNYLLFGGYNDAERRVVIFLPDYYSYDDVTNDPSLAELTFAFVTANKFDSNKAEFSHRDILGSLMGLGIERDSVGDIITNGASAVFLIKTKLAEYVKDNLNKIGKYNVGVTLYDKYDITPKQDFQICLDTVASMRLDAVIASIYKLSRNLSTEYISGGKVYINGVQTTKSDITVKEGDKLTLRGKGKALIDSLDGLSKKGRIRFTYKKYK